MVLTLAAGLLAALPSGATAAVTCNFASATAAIDASSAGNTANVGRNVSLPLDGIIVNNSQCGGSATVSNTDTITFTDSSGSNTKLVVGLGSGPLAPGPTDESGGSDEIELTAAFGSGGFEFDLLEVDGCSAAPPCATANDHIVWGSGGINLNADEAPIVDADLTASGVEVYQSFGGSGNGNDTLAADGGFGTGIASLTPVQFTGFDGMDFLTGGTMNDGLDGGADNDVLVGGTGDDNIVPGPGDDQLDGEGGAFDIANFGPAANGVTVDLSNPGAQDTGEGTDLILNMESLFGSGFDDPLLSGTNGANNIQAGGGDDVIAGLDGDDSLSGDGGDDVIEGGPDGGVVGDTIFGGGGKDTADYASATGVVVSLAKTTSQQTGGAGVDTLTDMEGLAGSPLADTLKGNGGANVLKGRGGKDKVKGAKGKDTMNGGGGADVLLARDGAADVVRCGKGHDVAKADPADKLKGCEEKHV
jgi:RTX calcium-binding nonapeptide repeat (4 copies)